MKFKPADVLKALVTIENGFNRMKKVYPNAIPMFQVFSSTDSEFISVFVCEVTDFYPEENTVKFDTVSEKSKLMKLDKMKVPYSCPNFIESYCFYPQIEETISNIINEKSKTPLTSQERLDKLNEIIEGMKK